MLFPHSKIELSAIQLLAKGPKRVVDIVAELSRKDQVTPEAVYLGLRNLQKKRVLVKTKGISSLYVFWIQEMQKLVGSIEQNYGKEYTSLLVFRDILDPSFHSKTLKCSDFETLENTFHHIAQSLIQPQEKLRPYFFFGFAPWWMTLCPDDADAFIKLVIKYNYQPLMIFAKQYPIDKETVKRLRNLGCQIVFVGASAMPFGFEGHYVNGICLEARYGMPQYAKFHATYGAASLKDKPLMENCMRELVYTKVKVTKKKIPFSKNILNLFAVPSSLFKA